MALLLLQLVRDTIKIDPVALYPNASHEPLKDNFFLNAADTPWKYFLRRTILGSCYAFFRNLLANLLGLFPLDFKQSPNSIFFACFSTNQRHALHDVASQMASQSEADVVMHDRLLKEIIQYDQNGDSTIDRETGGLKEVGAWGYLVALPFLPLLIIKYFRASGYAKQSFSWAFNAYWLCYGLYFVTRFWLHYKKPLAIVLSNDHVHVPLCLNKAAQDEGIPTFYIQHACVTDKFPPLQTDYALLDGRDALEKYDGAGPSDAIAYLIGLPRSDKYVSNQNKNTKVEKIGICTSIADEISLVEILLRKIAKADLALEVTIRPHPRTAKDFLDTLESIRLELGYGLSDSTETAFEFLSKNDAVIAGISAITLEAAMLNVTPIHYVLNESTIDWYGFIKTGLCQSFAKPEKLISYLQDLKENRPSASEVASFYCETIGTNWHGRSCELASNIIEAIALGKDVDEGYIPLHSTRLKAFGLRDE